MAAASVTELLRYAKYVEDIVGAFPRDVMYSTVASVADTLGSFQTGNTSASLTRVLDDTTITAVAGMMRDENAPQNVLVRGATDRQVAAFRRCLRQDAAFCDETTFQTHQVESQLLGCMNAINAVTHTINDVQNMDRFDYAEAKWQELSVIIRDYLFVPINDLIVDGPRVSNALNVHVQHILSECRQQLELTQTTIKTNHAAQMQFLTMNKGGTGKLFLFYCMHWFAIAVYLLTTVLHNVEKIAPDVWKRYFKSLFSLCQAQGFSADTCETLARGLLGNVYKIYKSDRFPGITNKELLNSGRLVMSPQVVGDVYKTTWFRTFDVVQHIADFTDKILATLLTAVPESAQLQTELATVVDAWRQLSPVSQAMLQVVTIMMLLYISSKLTRNRIGGGIMKRSIITWTYMLQSLSRFLYAVAANHIFDYARIRSVRDIPFIVRRMRELQLQSQTRRANMVLRLHAANDHLNSSGSQNSERRDGSSRLSRRKRNS